MPDPVAIVGISVEIPSGSYAPENLDHKSFFEFLLSGGEAYEEMPSDRFNVEAWKGTGIGKIHVNKGAFLKDIDAFDNVEFGISSKDAQAMAPASRKLVENSFLALLDSGIDYRTKRVGVFTSGTSIDLMNVSEPDEFDSRGSFAGYPAMIANRISNHLDLLGPSLPVDTACSSTLTAMHLAVQAIASGDCEAAVVGGCQLNHRFFDWFTYSQGSLLAKDGKCKPFDSSADGFSRAEACGVVVIKPLADAIRDNDRIYATVLGTAINSTGGAAAPGAPVAESQRDAMIQAFERAGKSPREVDYVELHATGTAKGDPTEANWVGERFHREDDLLIGSVKANIGHTEIVAFLASLSKVISIFDQKVIPPQINIKRLNPGIKWDDYRLKVPLSATPLPVRNQKKSLVAISSSGIGGSNGHVVLESPPPVEEHQKIAVAVSHGPVLLTLGTLSSRTVSVMAESIKANLPRYSSDLQGLSTVLGRRSKQGTYRSYGIISPDGAVLSEFTTPVHTPRLTNSMVFVFSGQGPQHQDMGRQLFQQFPVFRQSVLEMDVVFQRLTGKSIIRDYGLFDKSTAPALPEIWPIALVLPSIAIFQMALFDLLTSLGVKPDVVVGHSAGETAVLYASGAAPKAMAVELAIIRGKSFTPIEQLGGTMAALSCTPEVLDELIQDYRKADPKGRVELACYNSPSAVAIAGDEVALDAVVAAASARGIFARKIRTKVPFHSSVMEASKQEYLAALKDLFKRYPGAHVPETATFSTCTGDVFDGSFDADYYWSNTRAPVRFTQTMAAITAAHPNATFVEFSPHPVLVPYIMSMISESSTVCHSMQRPKRGGSSTEHVDVLHLLGKITSAGHNSLNFTTLNGKTCSQFSLPLPAYPFAKKKYPLYPDTPGVAKQMAVPRGPINHAYLRMNKDTHPMLAEHVIRGQPIMPAAGYLEMAVEFGASTLINVNLRSIMSLSSEKPVKVDITLDGAYWAVKSITSSKSRKDGSSSSNERLHADGYLSFEVPKPTAPLDIEEVRSRCTGHIGSGFYPSLSYFSAYGPPFQRVTNMYFNENEALASIKGLDSALLKDGNYFLHPAILDACIQVSAYKPFHGDYDPNVYYLPAHVDALIVHQGAKQAYFPGHLYAHVQLKKWKPDGMVYDISLVDDSGKRLCTFVGLEVAKHHINPVTDAARPLEVAMQPVFHSTRPKPRTQCAHPDRSILFSTLDKMAIQLKMGAKGGPGNAPGNMMQLHPRLRNEAWTPYFDTLASAAEKNLPVSEGPQFDQTILCVMESFRTALKAFQKAPTRLLQILIASNVKTEVFQQGVDRVLQEFKSLHIDVFVDNKHPSQGLPTSPSGITRNVRLNLEDPTPISEGQLFDIVLLFNVANSQITPQVIAKAADTLLVSGGSLIVAERNLDAWNEYSLGTVWYDTVFGSQASETHALSAYQNAMSKFSQLRVHKSEDADPFHFCIEAQKARWTADAEPEAPVYDPEESFAYHYSFGNEMDLQWELSGLNTSQHIDIWIMATEGRDGGAAKGIARAMRREYVSWTIRLVIFPESFDEEAREEYLEKLPVELRHEQDIVVSAESSDVLLVPRVVPVQPLSLETRKDESESWSDEDLPAHHALVKVISYSKQGLVSGILAVVVDEKSTTLKQDELVVGLVTGTVEEFMIVDSAALTVAPPELADHAHIVPVMAPGFASAILASGLGAFSRLHRMKDARILLTHADSAVGLSVLKLASKSGLKVEHLSQDASLHDLAERQGEQFDIVISGYTDRSYVQVLRLLLDSDRGHLFLWNDERDGLAGILKRDPYSVGDALAYALNVMREDINTIDIPERLYASTEPVSIASSSTLRRSSYDSDKTYVILGGIGTIGVHLALFMYQRGARHVILTSRSGRKSLNTNSNVVVKRMVNFMENKADFDLSLHAVDATDSTSMANMFDNIGSNLGGCILLTAVLSDGIFSHLEEKDFTSVYAAKLGAISTLKEVVDFDAMDFFVAFTSVSGLFGFGGQTNYGAANTALEEEVMDHQNAFSFTCPGVLDSTLMLAGTGETNESRLSAVIPWSSTAEDMIQWFDDAMYRFQNGQRITRYVPDLAWDALERTQGMPRSGRHLLPNEAMESTSDLDEVAQMAKIVRNVLDIPETDFSPDVPLTAYGIDSLSASRISFLLRPFVEVTQIQLLGDISVSDIAASCQSDEAESSKAARTPKPTASRKKTDIMQDMLAKYSHDMKDVAELFPHDNIKPAPGSAEVVLVTGTTGTLGSNLLAKLLQDPAVSKVYAFNRPGASGETSHVRHRTAFARQGLSLPLLVSPKLVLLEGDLTKENFGLSSAEYAGLLSTVTRVIHNAWKVDFATPLDAHEGSIHGTRKLLDFALQSSVPSKASVSLVSSIGIYQSPKDTADGFSPEEPVMEPSVSIQTGYIESKWVAERLVEMAAEVYGISTNVLRVGLLTGGSSGYWDPSQWFPAIAQSASYLGCLPRGDDTISWIPVHLAASAITDMRRTDDRVLHIVHPKPVQWSTIMKSLSETLNVPLVPYMEWFARLESSANDEDESASASENSRAALRMTHFYRLGLNASKSTESMGLLAKVRSEKGVRASPSLRSDSVLPLSAQDVNDWVANWKKIGFLP
ncbi:hypothetical protein D9613_010407 [Agrocybe pediades]|uniref:Polyketide synthase n=1 Tax=Agrocybe pediades TaxID=84607 RepID=A0A8H4QG67_9AGAR|nr:hypothetical protein D9613_010407 [Agrocybe pediades]